MHLVKAEFHGNPNIGLYVYANNEYCIAGPDVPQKALAEIAEALKVKPIVLTIAGTSLWGILCAGNSKCLLVPEIAFESELSKLKKLGINYKVIETEFTALGNNFLITENAGLANPLISQDILDSASEALGVKLEAWKVADLETPGAILVCNSKGGLAHVDATQGELDKLKELFKVPFQQGTANFGNPYLRSAIILNNSGLAIGSHSTGVEITDADIAFGFLEV